LATKKAEEDQNQPKLKNHKNGQNANDRSDPKTEFENESITHLKNESKNNDPTFMFPTIYPDNLDSVPLSFDNSSNGQFKKSVCSFKEFKTTKNWMYPKKLFSKSLVDEMLTNNEKTVQTPQLPSVE